MRLSSRDKAIIADLERFRCMSRDDIADIHFRNVKDGQKAAIVINLYYEEERRKAKERMVAGANETNEKRWGISGTPEMEGATVSGEVASLLAKKAGVSKTNIYYLLAIKRKRPDLYEKVFDGSYSIGKAHAEMKRDEQPQEVTEEKPLAAAGPGSISGGSIAHAESVCNQKR